MIWNIKDDIESGEDVDREELLIENLVEFDSDDEKENSYKYIKKKYL
jgi:hypothetical protein